MFEFDHGSSPNCEGVSRRQFLRVGGLGFAGLTLPTLLRLQADAKANPAGPAPAIANSVGKTKDNLNVILLWMQGGPSHIDTFDPKPDAPAEIRGEFGVIDTTIPGVKVCEHMPLLAKSLDKYTIIRNGYSYNGGHGIADAYMLSGWRFSPSTVYPSYGSVVARELGYRQGMPPYVQLGPWVDKMNAGGQAGYLGSEHNPFIINEDPNGGTFNIDGITLPGGMSVPRFSRRQRMLDRFDSWQRTVEKKANDVGAMDAFYEKAFSIVTSPAAKKAFDLSQEDPKLRDKYGRTRFGQSCLLARRLVQSGVRFVNVSFASWDTHGNNFASLKQSLLPPTDMGYSALLDDLDRLGMLDNTVVFWLGDFGRTPKINSAAGRDHWVGSTVFCIGGGGFKTGQVIGASNQYAEQPVGKSIEIEDIAATLYSVLGIPLDKHFQSPDGRPFKVNPGGRVLNELLV
ncbi:MAG: DUF1501 domain-containing protein [Planctomycetia bacterium]|nr:DUF1501 domain-containing protein [Planctomycetia bacterium]